MRGVVAGFAAVIAALIGLTVLFGSWYTIDQGERGVLLTNGAVTSVEGPGLHFKVPWFQTVREIDVRQQVVSWSCYTGNDCPSPYRYVMESYSKDQQAADLRVTLNFRVPEDKAAEVYSRYGSVEGLANQTVARFAPEAIKEVFGQYTAPIVVQSRAKFNAEAEEAVKASVKGYPVIVDSVQIEDIGFGDAYENAVTARMQAEVEVAKQNQTLAKEKVNAEIAVTQAKAAADSQKLAADAAAYAIKAQGDAQAQAIKARADALAANAALVELTKAERWNGQLPTAMVPGNAVPFLDVGARP